jgi:hypothetical protein
MNYGNINSNISNISFEKKYLFSIFSLYLFSLGSLILGYSLYLLLEGVGLVDQSLTTWTGQSMFWFLILFFVALFILFIPIEFFTTFKIFNSTFKDLILNILIVIFISLFFLVFFQFIFSPTSQILSSLIDLGKAISFSGFIAVPLLLFGLHNLQRTINFSDNFSYSLILFFWMITSQIFL